ncbi:hypothetical protein [Burkholderia pseudomallei]|uniref:hypothetical protein n=1 Tax=Burkholderia pseudomallei TaxID=28450 RepID=UPI002AB59FAC|nr:hypothetical protein [Burkholderia pseudomallei]MDY7820219.1 hypothetical protein [Burkholderia pseudomallei]MDY7866852.1 hypothetical protein [Burkholderia pseudomallei]
MRAATFAARDAISTGSRPICIERAPRLLGRRRGDAATLAIERARCLTARRRCRTSIPHSSASPALNRDGAANREARGTQRCAARIERPRRLVAKRAKKKPGSASSLAWPLVLRHFCGSFAALLRLSSRLSRLLPHHVGPPLDRMPAARARVELRGIAPPNRLRAGRD